MVLVADNLIGRIPTYYYYLGCELVIEHTQVWCLGCLVAERMC